MKPNSFSFGGRDTIFLHILDINVPNVFPSLYRQVLNVFTSVQTTQLMKPNKQQTIETKYNKVYDNKTTNQVIT
jgi:hypothetical protein